MMDALRDAMLILHFVGLAALLGGVAVQLVSRRQANPVGKGNVALAHSVPALSKVIVYGTLIQLVTGFALTGIADYNGDANHAKVAVKTIVLVVIAVIVFLYRRRDRLPAWVLPSIATLTLANIAIAVVW
ncbi:MAG: hypothetical protein R2826_06995 [Thermoleophilia bacterium]